MCRTNLENRRIYLKPETWSLVEKLAGFKQLSTSLALELLIQSTLQGGQSDPYGHTKKVTN